MFQILQKLNQIRPKPFKWLQRGLGITEEWSQFKTLIRPHKFKVLSIGFLAVYPIYQAIAQKHYTSLNQKVQEQLQDTKPMSKILETFIKQLVEDALRDNQIRRESAIYGEAIVKKQEALDPILVLLLDAVKDPKFLHESKALAKTLGTAVIRDKVIEKNTINFVLNVVKDPEVKYEIQEAGKWIVRDEALRKDLVDMCRTSASEERFMAAMREVMAKSMADVMADKVTSEKLKAFAFYVLENEADNLKGSAKELISNIADKVGKGYRVENKDSEFKRVLEEEGNEDTYESIRARKKSANRARDASYQNFASF